MTFILKLDLDMVKVYLHTKNEVSVWKGLKLVDWTDWHTDRYDWKHYLTTDAGGNFLTTRAYFVQHKYSFGSNFQKWQKNLRG